MLLTAVFVLYPDLGPDLKLVVKLLYKYESGAGNKIRIRPDLDS